MQKTIVLIAGLLLPTLLCFAQIVTECPANIGFETGTFSSWECATGFISETGRNSPSAQRPAVISLSASSAISGTHTLVPRGSSNPYGGFSLDAPNGSEYVVKLGNELNGRGAESISYTINVPADVESYSIIFNYAVVFENPDHEFDEQPKFTAKVIDLSTNTFTECGSFEFTAPGPGGGIPGFQMAPNADSILYKPWSPVMVNLSNYLGKTIRLEFTTNDCSRGRHFGYAYIDFNDNCSIPIIGNIRCPESESLSLNVIPGLASYYWFNAENLEGLGTAENLLLSPVPPSGTRIGVELTPYAGLGCKQVLYTTITDIYMNVSNPAERCVSVDITATNLRLGNSSDLTYTYWEDSEATTAIKDPRNITIDGTYYIKGTSSSNCSIILPVDVSLTKLQQIGIRNPPAVNFPESVDITNSYIPVSGLDYSYWMDAEARVSLPEPQRIRRSGTFFIQGRNAEGCKTISGIDVTVILPDFFIPNAFTPNGDGINDEFTIIMNNKDQVKSFKIFNRWGEIVYETRDVDRYWDGFKNDTKVPVGVYYWLLESEESAAFPKKSGYVSVLR